MVLAYYAPQAAACLFMAMLIIARWGFVNGQAQLKKNPHFNQGSFKTVEGPVFALLGLLLAFSYSGAYSRLEIRRHLVVQEANAISTSFVRLDLLAEENQIRLKKKLIDYADTKLQLWRKLPDLTKALEFYEQSLVLQKQIWQEAVKATNSNDYQPMRILVLPPINQFIDLSLDRFVAMKNHTPWVIYLLIYCLAITSAWMAGFAQAALERYAWSHISIFAFLVSFTFYVIQDLDYPSLGLIQLDEVNEIFDKIKLDFKNSL